MRTALLALAMLFSVPSLAQEEDDDDSLMQESDSEWGRKARFFGGVRGGIAIPTGGLGPAPSVGFEIGVSVPSGLGFGLHILGMDNPPAIPALGIQKAGWGIGALADLRLYFQSVAPLTLYGTLSGGFVAGPGTTGNVVLPLVNPGFGARVKLTDSMYVAFEFGAAGFFIPFINLSMGWEPSRRQRRPRAMPAAPLPPQTQQMRPAPANTSGAGNDQP